MPENILTSSLRRRPSSPVTAESSSFRRERKGRNIVKQLDGSREWLGIYLSVSSIHGTLLELVESLVPAVESSCTRNSPVGCHARGLTALQQLHSMDKKYVHTDQLMVPTLGSQEGAFENVRMNFAGEQVSANIVLVKNKVLLVYR